MSEKSARRKKRRGAEGVNLYLGRWSLHQTRWDPLGEAPGWACDNGIRMVYGGQHVCHMCGQPLAPETSPLLMFGVYRRDNGDSEIYFLPFCGPECYGPWREIVAPPLPAESGAHPETNGEAAKQNGRRRARN